MKKWNEEREQEKARIQELEKLQKNHQKINIVDSYKYQMDKRRHDQEVKKMEEQVYGSALKTSIDTMQHLDQAKRESQRHHTKEYAE